MTRKHNRHAWHWRQIVPHVRVLALLLGSMAWSLAHHGVLNSFDIGSAYWAGLYSLLLLGFVRLSWHGAELRLPRPRLRPLGGAIAAGPEPALASGTLAAAEPLAPIVPTRSAAWATGPGVSPPASCGRCRGIRADRARARRYASSSCGSANGAGTPTCTSLRSLSDRPRSAEAVSSAVGES